MKKVQVWIDMQTALQIAVIIQAISIIVCLAFKLDPLGVMIAVLLTYTTLFFILPVAAFRYNRKLNDDEDA